MKLGILINEGPYQHQASDTALQYVKAAIKKGHEIYRVFFYNDGVNNATRLATPPQDDRNITKEWQAIVATPLARRCHRACLGGQVVVARGCLNKLISHC